LTNYSYDWKHQFGFGEVEIERSYEVNEEIATDSYEAMTRFYQKENKRSKTSKQKKLCWQ